MPRCAAYGCKNTGKHLFPKDPKRRKLWEEALGNKNWKSTKSSSLCRDHFRTDDYISESAYTGNKPLINFLKRSVVPSVFSFSEMETDLPSATERATRLESRAKERAIFSWQESKPISLYESQNDVVPDRTQPKGTDVQNESTQETLTSDNRPPVDDYCCDGCKENITGFRYTCVQCADYDLCGACERLMLHAQHYVLRVPPGKSAKEVRLILEAIRIKLDTIEDHLMFLNYGIVKIKKEEDPFEEVANENENLILATSAPEGVADVSSRRDEVPKFVSKMATGDGDRNVGNKYGMSFMEDWLDDPFLEMYEDADPLRAVSKDTVEPSMAKQSGEKHIRNIEKSYKEPIIKLLSSLETHDSDKQSGPKQYSLLKLPPRQILKRKSEITNSEPKKLLLEIHPLKISDGRATQSASSQPTSTSRESDVTKEERSESYAFFHTYAKKPSSDPRLSTDSKFIEKKYVKRK